MKSLKSALIILLLAACSKESSQSSQDPDPAGPAPNAVNSTLNDHPTAGTLTGNSCEDFVNTPDSERIVFRKVNPTTDRIYDSDFGLMQTTVLLNWPTVPMTKEAALRRFQGTDHEPNSAPGDLTYFEVPPKEINGFVVRATYNLGQHEYGALYGHSYRAIAADLIGKIQDGKITCLDK